VASPDAAGVQRYSLVAANAVGSAQPAALDLTWRAPAPVGTGGPAHTACRQCDADDQQLHGGSGELQQHADGDCLDRLLDRLRQRLLRQFQDAGNGHLKRDRAQCRGEPAGGSADSQLAI